MRRYLYHMKAIYTVMFRSMKMCVLALSGCLLVQVYWLGWMKQGPAHAKAEYLIYMFNSFAGVWILCGPFLAGLAGNTKANKHPSVLPTLPLSPVKRLLVESAAVVLFFTAVRGLVWCIWWLFLDKVEDPTRLSVFGLQELHAVENLLSILLLWSCTVTILAFHWLTKYHEHIGWLGMFLWCGAVYLGLTTGLMGTWYGLVTFAVALSLVSLLAMRVRWDRASLSRKRQESSALARPAHPSKLLLLRDLLGSSMRWAALFLVPGVVLAWYVVAQGMSGELELIASMFVAGAGATIIFTPSWKTVSLFHTKEDDTDTPLRPLGAGNLLPLSKHTLLRQVYTHGVLATTLYWLAVCILVVGIYLLQKGSLLPLTWDHYLLVVAPPAILGPMAGAVLVYRAARARSMLMGMGFALLLGPQALVATAFLWPSYLPKLLSIPKGWNALVLLLFLLAFSLRLPHYLWPEGRKTQETQ